MNPEILESHLLKIEKFIENTEKTATKLSSISIQQMKNTVDRILKNENNEDRLTPLALKLRKNWRDESLDLQPSRLGLFNLKGKTTLEVASQKMTQHKFSCNNDADKEEVFENSSNSENEEDDDSHYPNWVKMRKAY